MSEAPRPTLSSHDAPSPLEEVWAQAWPTVLTMTSYTVMQFVDKFMVAQVSPTHLVAQGNGGVWAFVPIGCVLGLLSVVNTYVAQSLGAGRPERGPQYGWASIWMSVAAWLVVLLPFAAAMPWLFSRMGHDPELVRLESGYGRILLAGAVFLMASRGISHYFFGMHRPRIVTASALAGNTVNVVCNYVFIFGSDGIPAWGLPGVPGMPAMGVYGAALGTVIGTIVELAIPLAVFLGPRLDAEARTRAAWRPKWGPIADVLRIGWPAAMQWGNEIAAWSIFMAVLIGKFGEDHMTAGWAALGYMHLSFMPAVGFSVAVCSLVGKYIGAGQPDVAMARARLGLGLAVGYMTACGVLFFVFRHPMIAAFVGETVDPQRVRRIVEIGGHLMICAAIFQTFDAVGITYSGALRGAGDTIWPGMVAMIYSWVFIVAGGWSITVLWPQLESVGPWIAAAVFIIAFGLSMYWRFETGRWRSIGPLKYGGVGPEPPAAAKAAPPTGPREPPGADPAVG